jgi:hypothetical protein
MAVFSCDQAAGHVGSTSINSKKTIALFVSLLHSHKSLLYCQPPHHPSASSPFALEKLYGLNAGSRKINPSLSKQFLLGVPSTSRNRKKERALYMSVSEATL